VAASRVAEAVTAALGALDARHAKHCMLGMAGVSKFSDPAIAEVFDSSLRRIGLRCPITVVSDADVAYASATAEPNGTVLIGGTGSGATRISDHRTVATVGGFGWLLGDEGSAYWIGREAVRATLQVLQAGAPVGPLANAVLTEALGAADTSTMDQPVRERVSARLITSANAEPPIRLARFASIVSATAAVDQRAGEIVRRAAALLAEQAVAARAPGAHTPVVLVGSVIGPHSPVGVALRAILSADHGLTVLCAEDGAAGAAWLAARAVLGPSAPRPVARSVQAGAGMPEPGVVSG
jgi:N-acetylglucosamine kinase-like BadF-type ATPase